MNKIVDITKLTAGDFARWLRKQVREGGRHVEVGTVATNPVEMWVKDLGYDRHFGFSLLGMIELEWIDETGYCREYHDTDWVDLCLYLEREDGSTLTDAYEVLTLINDIMLTDQRLFSVAA